MPNVDVVSMAIEPRLRMSLIAREPIATGGVILRCATSDVVLERTWRTVQIDKTRHLRNDLLDYVDHSCEPNSVLDCDRLELVALREIVAGEPITFYYPGSEVELAREFECHCGSRQCMGRVTGAFYLSAEQMRQALDAGYCTSFMAAQLSRLLQLPAYT